MNTRRPRFGCDFCNKRCTTETALRVHKRAVHLSAGVLCPYCSLILPANLLTKHVVSCRAVDVNTSDALLHFGHNGMEENYLDDIPKRLTSLRHVAVDWGSLIARSIPEPVENQFSDVSDGASDGGCDDTRLSDHSEKTPPAEKSETSPVSEVENLRAGMSKPPKRSRASKLNRSSMSALQRMLGVNRMLRNVTTSIANGEIVKDSDISPVNTQRIKRGPKKSMEGRPRKKLRLASTGTSDADNGNDIHSDFERTEKDGEAGEGGTNEKSAASMPICLSDDDDDYDDDTGVLTIDESYVEKEALTIEGRNEEPTNAEKPTNDLNAKKRMNEKKAKREVRKQKCLQLKKQMTNLVKEARDKFTTERREASLKSVCESPLLSKEGTISSESNDEDETRATRSSRRSKRNARKKIRQYKDFSSGDSSDADVDKDGVESHQSKKVDDCDLDNDSVYAPTPDEASDIEVLSQKGPPPKRPVRKSSRKLTVKDVRNRDEWFPGSENDDSSDLSMSSDVEHHRKAQKAVDDNYDSDFDFDYSSFDVGFLQTIVPCPSSTSPANVGSNVELILAPFASLFLCFVVDPLGATVAPPLPEESSLPANQFENPEDAMWPRVWTCEWCGIVKGSLRDKNIHLRAVHKHSIGIVCPFCRQPIPRSLYPVHTWLLCPEIEQFYKPALFRPCDVSIPQSFWCKLCVDGFETNCPIYFLRHVISTHSRLINAMSAERIECSRCSGHFHKAFIVLHDHLCRIAAEMNISLSDLATYHVSEGTAKKLGRPLRKILNKISLGEIIEKNSLEKSEQKTKKECSPKNIQTKSQNKRKKKNNASKVLINGGILKALPPRNDKKSTNTTPAPASIPHRLPDTDVVEIVDIPSSPDPQIEVERPLEKRNGSKPVNFAAIFLDNIFEPSSPPSSPVPKDMIEADSVDDLSNQVSVDGSVCSDRGLNFGFDKSDAADSKAEDSRNVQGSPKEKKAKLSNETSDSAPGTETANEGGNSVEVSNHGLTPCEAPVSNKQVGDSGIEIVDVQMLLKKNICEFCGEGSNLLPEFQAHKRKHKAAVRCPLCSTLIPRSLLYCHRRLFCRSLHKDVTWSLQCNLCQISVPSPFHLLRHALDCHPSNVSKKRGERPTTSEPMRERCEHCAAPVKPIFFDCHQEMCFRKLQFEIKSRPVAKKVEPTENNSEALGESHASNSTKDADAVVASVAKEVDSRTKTESSDSKVMTASGGTVDCKASNTLVADPDRAVLDAPKTALSDVEDAVTADVPSNTPPPITDDFESSELVGVSNGVTDEDVEAIIMRRNGYEAGLATPPHIDCQVENLDEDGFPDVKACDFNLLMNDSNAFDDGASYSSLRMTSSPRDQSASNQQPVFSDREDSGKTLNALTGEGNDASLFEDISEVLEAVMHDNCASQPNQVN